MTVLFELQFGRRKIEIHAGQAVSELIRLATERLREGRLVRGAPLCVRGGELKKSLDGMADDLRRAAGAPMGTMGSGYRSAATFFEALSSGLDVNARYELSMEDLEMLDRVRRLQSVLHIDPSMVLASDNGPEP
jgi:hypothetical protein